MITLISKLASRPKTSKGQKRFIPVPCHVLDGYCVECIGHGNDSNVGCDILPVGPGGSALINKGQN